MVNQSDGNGITSLKDITYPFLLNIVETYQKNYIGADKMTREYMLKEIERFIK